MASETLQMQNESKAAAISASQLVHFLCRYPPFSFLPEDELRALTPHISRVAFPADTVVFTQGESQVDGLYVIQSGAAERYFEQNRVKTLLGVIGEGEMFGGISMLVNDMRAVRTLRTVEETVFCKLDHAVFFDVCRRHDAFREFFTDAFGKRMLDRSYAAILAKGAVPRVDSTAFYNQVAYDVCTRSLVSCSGDLPVQRAADMMSRRRCSSIFVRDAAGVIVGIVTDSDLRRKVIAEGRSALIPVSEIMSAPLKTIASTAPVFEALMVMIHQRIKHLAVTDDRQHVVGVLTNRDVLGSQGHSPLVLIRDVAMAASVEAVRQIHLRLPRMVHTLVRAGTPAEHLNRIITAFSDAVLKRVCDMQLRDMEPPPVRFAFLVFGSVGRREQTLATDQDNAIVYEDPTPGAADYVNDYFLRFGSSVCSALDQCGFRFCRAEVMARNPALCRPVSTWKRRFSEWIHAAEAEDLLYSSIFFDFQTGFGHSDLVGELRTHLVGIAGRLVGVFQAPDTERIVIQTAPRVFSQLRPGIQGRPPQHVRHQAGHAADRRLCPRIRFKARALGNEHPSAAAAAGATRSDSGQRCRGYRAGLQFPHATAAGAAGPCRPRRRHPAAQPHQPQGLVRDRAAAAEGNIHPDRRLADAHELRLHGRALMFRGAGALPAMGSRRPITL